MPNALSTFLTLTVDGVSYGMMLFLISVGLTITMGVMRVVNLTHSAFAMIGGFFTLWLMSYAGLHFFAALPLGVAVTMLFSLVLERTLFQWVYKADALGQLLMTLGMTFVITAIVKNIAGPQIQSITLPGVLTGQLMMGSINISIYRLFVLGLSIAVAGGLWLCLEYTTFGARLRAAVDNPRMARCVGINVPLVFSITFAIGCGLAALGGAVGTQMLPLEPYYGLKYLVLVLIVVAVGGVGSLKGSLYSAVLLGLIDTMGRYYIPALGGFIIYLSVLAILLIRPRGLVARVG